MPITSRDVAVMAGVSQPTVSRALRGDPRVSAATRARVLRAAEALGYVTHEAGRSLATRRTHRIGVVLTDLGNPFYPHLVGPLHDELARLGYQMTMLTERSERALLNERLVDGSLDGAVLMTATLDSVLPAELTRRGFPFVFLNRDAATGGDAAVVENEAGGRLAADFLVSLGHRHIGALFGPRSTATGRDRELGFRLGLAEHGIAVPADAARYGAFEFRTGHALLEEVLAARPQPTAVFCGGDAIALGALNAALAAGIDVPGQVSVIGFDDIPMASWEAFRLTTVSYDLVQMVAGACRLLTERIEDAQVRSAAPRRLTYAPSLVERNTHAAAGA
ncbi:LacI family DNA-binding transcriptional regulator [Streptomyces longwoodensis]|uniref:LacI family DNA-binding transcriptional regulator n=1 Tax=Streptomyces longwoodensis TaxID=68231 RepID=UPI0033E7DC40